MFGLCKGNIKFDSLTWLKSLPSRSLAIMNVITCSLVIASTTVSGMNDTCPLILFSVIRKREPEFSLAADFTLTSPQHTFNFHRENRNDKECRSFVIMHLSSYWQWLKTIIACTCFTEWFGLPSCWQSRETWANMTSTADENVTKQKV